MQQSEILDKRKSLLSILRVVPSSSERLKDHHILLQLKRLAVDAQPGSIEHPPSGHTILPGSRK